MVDTEELQEQRRQEALKLYFEYFKHLTTLSVAAAVIILAIYWEGIAEQAWLYVPIALFGFAVFVAVFGMVIVLTQIRLGQATWWRPIALMALVTGMFGGGLLTFMYLALSLPLWLLVLVPIPVLVLLWWVYPR